MINQRQFNQLLRAGIKISGIVGELRNGGKPKGVTARITYDSIEARDKALEWFKERGFHCWSTKDNDCELTFVDLVCNPDSFGKKLIEKYAEIMGMEDDLKAKKKLDKKSKKKSKGGKQKKSKGGKKKDSKKKKSKKEKKKNKKK